MTDIELVIKITKEDLRIICERTKREIWEEYGGIDQRLMEAVQNGIPLPKCHGRLIDENDLWFEDIDNISCVTQRNVEHAPTIIEADKEE